MTGPHRLPCYRSGFDRTLTAVFITFGQLAILGAAVATDYRLAVAVIGAIALHAGFLWWHVSGHHEEGDGT